MACSTRQLGHLRQLPLPFAMAADSGFICSIRNTTSYVPALYPCPTVSPSTIRHNSSGSIPFTEKVRRKLWGTDNPPGLKDPYGGGSVLEEPSSEEVDVVPTAAQESPYVPATTWDGLEHVGTLDKWKIQTRMEDNQFSRCVSPAL